MGTALLGTLSAACLKGDILANADIETDDSTSGRGTVHSSAEDGKGVVFLELVGGFGQVTKLLSRNLKGKRLGSVLLDALPVSHVAALEFSLLIVQIRSMNDVNSDRITSGIRNRESTTAWNRASALDGLQISLARMKSFTDKDRRHVLIHVITLLKPVALHHIASLLLVSLLHLLPELLETIRLVTVFVLMEVMMVVSAESSFFSKGSNSNKTKNQ